jgi:hypothetical protein
MSNNIKELQVSVMDDAEWFTVGKKKDNRVISRIEPLTNNIAGLALNGYRVFDTENDIVAEIINLPVIVRYEKE